MFTFKKLVKHFALAGALVGTLGLTVAQAADDLTIGSSAPRWTLNTGCKMAKASSSQ